MNNYLDFIIYFIANQVNCNIYYNSKDLQIQLNRCYNTYDNIKILNLFDKETLLTYDYILSELYYLLTDFIPITYKIADSASRNIDKDEFNEWFSNLDLSEIFTILFFINKKKYIDMSDDDTFDIIISSVKTIKHF